VAAEVVDVRVADQHEVGPLPVQSRQDHLRRRLLDSGVDEQRALVAKEVLRERPRPENRLDPGDARRDLGRLPVHAGTRAAPARNGRAASSNVSGFSHGTIWPQSGISTNVLLGIRSALRRFTSGGATPSRFPATSGTGA